MCVCAHVNGDEKEVSVPRVSLAWCVVQTSDSRRPALEALPNLSLNVQLYAYQIRCALRALNEAALRSTCVPLSGLWIAL